MSDTDENLPIASKVIQWLVPHRATLSAGLTVGWLFSFIAT